MTYWSVFNHSWCTGVRPELARAVQLADYFGTMCDVLGPSKAVMISFLAFQGKTNKVWDFALPHEQAPLRLPPPVQILISVQKELLGSHC